MNSTLKNRLWRHSWRAVRLAALGYCAAVVTLLLFENSMLYRPATASQSWSAPPSAEVEEIELRTDDGTRIHAWWWPRPGSDEVLLYCHGNGGNLSRRGKVMGAFRDSLNANVLIFDYPGYGKSDGSPTEAGCYAAADAAYDWLTSKMKFAGERIIICGQSLGGGVAVELARRRPHRALVLLRTFTSAPAVAATVVPWAPVTLLMYNRFDNLVKIGQCERPVFIAQARDDRLVPFEHGRRLYAAARSPKLFCELDGGHNDPLPRELFVKLRQFLLANEMRDPG